MENIWVYLTFFVFIPVGIYLIATLVLYIKSPFKFPYWKYEFDVSGTRQPKMEDYIDQYLIDNRMSNIESHLAKVALWREENLKKIEKSLFKKRRQMQFDECLDYEKMFSFSFYRKQTRYKQVNYVRHPYTVTQTTAEFSCSYETLLHRFERLEDINFETTISVYNSKYQRRLMTKELRLQIAERDNYTCQICGKYMPDGVGLHIDHIIPVSKGGKSVPSNLQVLCSKCNGQKSMK